jgi:two-component system response regulator NreC
LAIQTVNRGNSYFSSALSEGFDLAEVLYQAKRSDQRTGVDALTSREREVPQLIAEGYTNQGIANELFISVKTVEAHKAHIMAKLHARNRTDLIRYAIRKGIVHLESVEEAESMLDGFGGGTRRLTAGEFWSSAGRTPHDPSAAPGSTLMGFLR